MNLYESINNLMHLNESRTTLWQTVYNNAVNVSIPEDQAELFTEFIWQKGSGMGGLNIPAKVRKYIQANYADKGEKIPDVIRNEYKFENGQPVSTGKLIVTNSGIGKGTFSTLPLDIIKFWYDEIFAPIYTNVNTTNKRNKIDLEQYLIKAREIVTSVMGKDYMIKNDTRPKIKYQYISEHTLGNYNEYTGAITISDAFKLSEDLIDDYMLNVVIHEFIHSLRSCSNKNNDGDLDDSDNQLQSHTGEWKRVADLVTQNTSHVISRYAQYIEGEAFHRALRKMGYEK